MPAVLLVLSTLFGGCADLQSALGLDPADAGGPPRSAVGPRAVQGIPIPDGAEVVFAGYLESDYQVELSIRGVPFLDAVRAYDGALRAGGWEGVQVLPEGLGQTVRAKRGARSLVARFEIAEAGVSAVIVLSAAPSAPPSFAPVGDLEDRDGGSEGSLGLGDGGLAAPAPSLPDGVPLPTGYRLASNRALVGGGWEVVLEVDASAEAARARLLREMVQMGWHFGGRPAARPPVAVAVTDAPALGERSGMRVSITATETAGSAGSPVATLSLTAIPVER